VAATNRNLAREVERGTFREDLFYRLDVVRVTLPPLRERADDIPLLVEHFVKQLRPQQAEPLPRQTVRALMAQAWPGNVRELRNAVARALSLGTGGAAVAAAGSETGPASAAPATGPAVDLAVPLKTALERVTS